MAEILLVDDDVSQLRMVALILRSEGFDVELAVGGEDGLEALGRQTPDLVILDLNMPGMNGKAFFQEARLQGYGGPVLICSAFGAKAARLELGAEASIAKPFDPLLFLNLVDGLVSRGQQGLPGI